MMKKEVVSEKQDEITWKQDTGASEKRKISNPKGAGRKKVKGKVLSFKPDLDLESCILAQDDRSAFLNRCVRSYVRYQQSGREFSSSEKYREGEMPVSDHLGFFPFKAEVDLQLPITDQRIIAGFPSPVSGEYMEHGIDLNKELVDHPAATYLARATGNSMTGAGVEDGDLLVIDKLRQPTESALCVCSVDGEFTLKRVRKVSGRLFLIPDNPDYPAIEVSPERDFRIWGVVNYIIKKR